MILIKNKQRKYPIDGAYVRAMVAAVLVQLGYADWDVGIWFASSATIAHYNRDYRSKRGPTDILSFPYYQARKPGVLCVKPGSDEQNIGDMIICPSFLYTHERWADVAVDDRLAIVLVHGLCHLVGYDHETDADYALMHKKEIALLSFLKKTGN